MANIFRRYFRERQLRTSEPFFKYLEKWILLSSLLGLMTGGAVAVFDYVTNLKLWAYFSNFFSIHVYAILPIVIAGLLISGLLLKWSSTPSGSGTEQVVEAYNEDEELDYRSFFKKMLAAVITIGFGGSAGQEGPSVYAGGAIGSWLWTRLNWSGLNSYDRKIMLLAGAAAGIGAVFKAPLTGIVFALEAPFKDDLAHDALVPSMVASVTSYLVLISIDGSAPLFRFAGAVDISMLSLVDMATAAVLAAICGLSALVFIWAYKNVTRILLKSFPRFYFRAVIGGIVVSIIGILSVVIYKAPYPLGLSYDLIKLALSQNSLSTTLLILFGMKLVATSFTMGSTGDGGIFIPQIVMGAAIGGAFGQIVAPSRIDLFVAIGMASFLAAGYKTPLASVTFVAETTANPAYLIPSLIGSAISYSITGEASVSDHQKLRNEIDITQIAHLKASDVMTTRVIAVPAEVSVLDFVEEYLFIFQHKRFPVVDREGLVGIISAGEIKDVPREKWFETKIIDVCNRNYRAAYPDSDLQKIMDLMNEADIGRVPIVDKSRPTKILGIVSKADIIRALERERLGSTQ
jgi:CIC family chloride channel protein